jgi:hypothetical protein
MYEYRKASGKFYTLPPKLWTEFRDLFQVDYRLPSMGYSETTGQVCQMEIEWFNDFLGSEHGAKMANRLLQVSLALIPTASAGYYELSLMADVVIIQRLKGPSGREVFYLRPESLCIREVHPPDVELVPKAT